MPTNRPAAWVAPPRDETRVAAVPPHESHRLKAAAAVGAKSLARLDFGSTGRATVLRRPTAGGKRRLARGDRFFNAVLEVLLDSQLIELLQDLGRLRLEAQFEPAEIGIG